MEMKGQSSPVGRAIENAGGHPVRRESEPTIKQQNTGRQMNRQAGEDGKAIDKEREPGKTAPQADRAAEREEDKPGQPEDSVSSEKVESNMETETLRQILLALERQRAENAERDAARARENAERDAARARENAEMRAENAERNAARAKEIAELRAENTERDAARARENAERDAARAKEIAELRAENTKRDEARARENAERDAARARENAERDAARAKEIAELRTENAERDAARARENTELRTEFVDRDAARGKEIADLRTDIAELKVLIAHQSRNTLFMLAAVVAILGGLDLFFGS